MAKADAKAAAIAEAATRDRSNVQPKGWKSSAAWHWQVERLCLYELPRRNLTIEVPGSPSPRTLRAQDPAPQRPNGRSKAALDEDRARQAAARYAALHRVGLLVTPGKPDNSSHTRSLRNAASSPIAAWKDSDEVGEAITTAKRELRERRDELIRDQRMTMELPLAGLPERRAAAVHGPLSYEETWEPYVNPDPYQMAVGGTSCGFGTSARRFTVESRASALPKGWGEKKIGTYQPSHLASTPSGLEHGTDDEKEEEEEREKRSRWRDVLGRMGRSSIVEGTGGAIGALAIAQAAQQHRRASIARRSSVSGGSSVDLLSLRSSCSELLTGWDAAPAADAEPARSSTPDVVVRMPSTKCAAPPLRRASTVLTPEGPGAGARAHIARRNSVRLRASASATCVSRALVRVPTRAGRSDLLSRPAFAWES